MSPAYDYECTQCEAEEEVCHGMLDDPKIECSKCGGIMEKIIKQAPMGFIGPRTLGQLADKNTSKLSDEEKKAISEKGKLPPKELPKGMKYVKPPPKEKSWYDQYKTKTNQQVRQMTTAERKKYIETGK